MDSPHTFHDRCNYSNDILVSLFHYVVVVYIELLIKSLTALILVGNLAGDAMH